MVVDRVVRFDEDKGYGFIAPDDGDSDVFVHAKELTAHGVRVSAGTRVKFDVIEGSRGRKAYDVVAFEEPRPSGESAAASVKADSRQDRQPAGDEFCEVLSKAGIVQRITDLSLESVPELTGSQVLTLRRDLLRYAQGNGWVC